MRSKISWKLIFASCVILRSRVLLGLFPHQEYYGSATSLSELQCSLYQGQQGVHQSVRGNYKTRFLIQPKSASGISIVPAMYLKWFYRIYVRSGNVHALPILKLMLQNGMYVPNMILILQYVINYST